MQNVKTNHAPIRKYYTAQLAILYGVDFHTMYEKLREFVPILGEKPKGHPWQEREVVYIFYKLGMPAAKPISKPGRKARKDIEVDLKF